MKKKHMSLPATVKSWLRRTDSWVPLGMSGQKELSSLAWGLAVSALLSLIFPGRLADRYQSLYIVTRSARILKPDAQMESFASLMSGALLGFLILALAMIPLAVYHYGYHFRGSKSIYTMRRLPSKHPLARRCLTVPVLGAAAAALSALLLICLYYLLYIAVTPEQCLVPGQWQKFWSI